MERWPSPGTGIPVSREREVRVPYDDPGAPQVLAGSLQALLAPWRETSHDLILVCIGTDRSTGDSLGPLVGRSVKGKGYPGVHVYGTLDEPVHAGNLPQVRDEIARDWPGRPVLAIDACLGRLENVGKISVGAGSVNPGSGVNKSLPPVGDLYITGTVNVGGFMEYFILQNTRLSLVVGMAEIIERGLGALFAGSEWRGERTRTPVRDGAAP